MFVARCLLGSILDRLGCLFIFGEYQGCFFNSIEYNSDLSELYVVCTPHKVKRPVHRKMPMAPG